MDNLLNGRFTFSYHLFRDFHLASETKNEFVPTSTRGMNMSLWNTQTPLNCPSTNCLL